MNLSQIIESKKEKFDEDYKKQIESELGELAVSGIRYFLEKAIRESVEEALREVRPKEDNSIVTEQYSGGTVTTSIDGGFVDCLKEFDGKVKEFMK